MAVPCAWSVFRPRRQLAVFVSLSVVALSAACSKLDDRLAGPLAPPTASVVATADTVAAGDTVTLTVTSTEADRGFLTPPGVEILNGSVDVAPEFTTTYLFAVTGPGGSGYDAATVVVETFGPPRPAVTLTADRAQVQRGEPVTLTVTSEHADLGVVVPTSTVILNGQLTVTPEVTTTYLALVEGKGGSAFASVTVEVIQPQPPSVTLTVSADTIQAGESVTVTVASDHAVQGLLLPVNQSVLNGQVTDTPEATTTYLVLVEGPGGTALAGVTVVVIQPSPSPPPVASIQAVPDIIAPGDTVVLTVTSVDADDGFLTPPGLPLLNQSVKVTPAVTTTYLYAATGPGGTVYAAKTVDVVTGSPDPLPSVMLTANPATIQRGETVTLTVASTDATDGLVVPTGTAILNGQLTDAPEATTTYLAIVEGPGGSAFTSATVDVVQPPEPTVTLSASADTIQLGETVTLTVASTDATDGLVVPTNATVLNGQIVDAPDVTTTYLVVVEGPGGSAFASVRVVVLQPAPPPRPTATIEATPARIDSGETVVLTLTSTDADYGLLVPSAISMLNGDVTLIPDRTTTYLFAVSGPGGAAFDAVTVWVGEDPPPPPTATITANPAVVPNGGQCVLTVTSMDGYFGEIQPIGVQILNGDVIVQPVQSTVYTFTVEGLGGSTSDSVQVTVVVGN